MTAEDIKERWRQNGAEASAAGTWTHAQCECVLNGGHVAGECLELSLFRRFLGSTEPLLAYRTEWIIWAEKENLAGCIDFAALDGDGCVVLFDWKRTKGLPNKYANRWRRMRDPLHHLEDAAGIKYRLQLNVYKWILENYYDLKVAAVFVVRLHPELNQPFVDPVPNMQAEAAALISRLGFTGADRACAGGLCFPLGGDPKRRSK